MSRKLLSEPAAPDLLCLAIVVMTVFVCTL